MKKILLIPIILIFIIGCTVGIGEKPIKESINEADDQQPVTPPLQEAAQEKIPLGDKTVDTQLETKVNKIAIGEVAKAQLSELTSWTDTAISMEVPVGWNIYNGGECATKSILIRDPAHSLKQIFYFSEAGPVYTNQQQKEFDHNYVEMGGYPILWVESPVVNPLTAENFLIHFGEFASTPLFQQAFPQVPIMSDIEIVNTQEIDNKPPYAIDAKLIRAEFQQDGKEGEGYFLIVTADVGMGLGYGMMFVGITSPKGLLDLITPSLTKSLESFTISQEYVNSCIAAQNQAAAGALKAGKTLSETSDIIMETWENKLAAEERISEKQSDAILSQSRLYNSDTDEVYEVTPEFYDYYKIHNDQFEMSQLQEVPDDKWGYAPLNGAAHIR